MINWESVSHIMFTFGFMWGRGWVIHDQICLGKVSSKQNKAFNMVIYVWESERWDNISGSTFIFLTYFTTGSTFTDHLAGPVFQVLHFGKWWGSVKRAPLFSLRDVAEANLRENWFPELIFFLNVTCGNPRDKFLSTNVLTSAEHILKSGIFKTLLVFDTKHPCSLSTSGLAPARTWLCSERLQKYNSHHLRRLKSVLEDE